MMHQLSQKATLLLLLATLFLGTTGCLSSDVDKLYSPKSKAEIDKQANALSGSFPKANKKGV